MSAAKVSKRVLDSRRRAAARQRALIRLAHEYAERYRQLYSEEREVESS
jgi:hypothetical protein